MGFDEIREFINAQKHLGLHFCASGATLNKNNYQYYKNLVFIKFFDEAGLLVKQSTLLFQSSSIQGHHSPEGRPWVALETHLFSEQLLSLLQEKPSSEVLFAKSEEPQYQLDKSAALASITTETIEPSAIFLFSKADKDFYMLTWLKPVAGVGANVYTTALSPQYALFSVDSENQLEKLKQSSAFNSLLIPAEKLLDQAINELPSKTDSAIISEYIEALSQP